MEIVQVEISKLKFAEYNPRQISEKDFEALKNSIEEFGFVEPVVVNKDFTIIGGHMRVRAGASIGLKQVPCYFVDLDKNKEKVLNIALNKISGEWDFDKLTGLLSELEQLSDVAVDLTGFDEIERNGIFDEYGIEENEKDDEIPEVKKTNIKTGDLFQLGNHRLLCGDCTKEENVAKLMNGKKADMIFTDPPYGINIVKIGGGGKTKFGKIGGGKWVKANYYRPIKLDDKEYNPEFLLDKAEKIIIFGGNYFANKLPNSRCWLIWDKTGENYIQNDFADCEIIWTNLGKISRIYRCKWRGLLKEKGEDLRKRIHPAQKPLKLLTEIINDYTNKEEIIMDLYGGSGSTLIACEKTNRICYMMEIDPLYCEVICERWEQYVGGKRIKL